LFNSTNTYASFRITNWKTKFISEILEASIPSLHREKQNENNDVDDDDGYDDNDIDNEKGLSQTEFAKWYMIELIRMEPEALTGACEHVGIPIHSNKLTAEEFFVMAQEGNFSRKGERAVRKVLLANKIKILPSDNEMRSLGVCRTKILTNLF